MTERKPNVLLICADQWRADCISALGHPHVRTPNLDALAADGVLFENHFGQCTPCGPSRTSLLTGLYLMNHRSGRNGTPLDQRHTNVALEARRLGYEPALFGYTDTSIDPRGRHPDDPALRAYDEGIMPGFVAPLHLPEEMGPWVADLIARGYDFPTGRDEVFRPRRNFRKPADRGFRFIPTEFSAAESETAFLTDRFLQWLTVRRDRPWFAHFVFFRPHPPLIAPEPYNAMVDPHAIAMPARKPSPEEEARQHPFLRYAIDRYRPAGAYDELSPLSAITADDLEIRQMMAAYFGLVAEVDAHLGRIVAQLKASGAYDDTLIIVTSDHAEMLGEHFLWSKEVYFDQAFRIPLVIRDPRPGADPSRGRRVTQFTQAIDIAPTILDWLGGEVPRAMDGRSLVPFLAAGPPPPDWPDHVFFEHDFREVASQAAETALGLGSDQCSYAVLRDADYKYVHFAALPPLLFDMRADPHETTNLAADPAMQPVLLRYAQKMLSWRLTETDRTLTNMQLSPGGLISRR
jgi:arylsulfatase A-like enzyme